jgi:hypothetical protein
MYYETVQLQTVRVTKPTCYKAYLLQSGTCYKMVRHKMVHFSDCTMNEPNHGLVGRLPNLTLPYLLLLHGLVEYFMWCVTQELGQSPHGLVGICPNLT